MYIIVGDPPSATASVTTADVPEHQILFGGRHHILWQRITRHQWVVTSPDKRICVIGINNIADGVTLGRGVTFPVRGRPFLVLPALSAMEWETLRGEALGYALRCKADPPPALAPPSGHVSVAPCWRTLCDGEEFVYDHRTRLPEVPGYAVDLVLRGHVCCRCDRSQWVKWFLPHSPNRSTWPWGFARVEMYVGDLLRSQPDSVAVGHSSCGFIITDDMSRRGGFGPLRTPTLSRRVRSRLRLLVEMAASTDTSSAGRPLMAAHYYNPPPAPSVRDWAPLDGQGASGAAWNGGYIHLDGVTQGTPRVIFDNHVVDRDDSLSNDSARGSRDVEQE